MVLKTDGTVWATGDNRYGQLGFATEYGTKTYRTRFVQVVPYSGQCDTMV